MKIICRYKVVYILLYFIVICISNASSQSTIQHIYYNKIKLRPLIQSTPSLNGSLHYNRYKTPTLLFLFSDSSYLEIHFSSKVIKNAGKWKDLNDTLFVYPDPQIPVTVNSKKTNENLQIIFYDLHSEELIRDYQINLFYKGEQYLYDTDVYGKINSTLSSFDSYPFKYFFLIPFSL